MLLGIVLVAILTLAVVLARFAIARFFLGDAAGNATATIDLAATLLLVGATFFVTDGVQSVAVGSLRGMKDTRIPLLFAAISYWLIGFHIGVRARLLDAARRGRRLDRAVLRHDDLRHPSRLALSSAGEQIGAS